MDLSLLYFESDLDELSLLRGEELFETNRINHHYKAEKNLWVATIEDGEIALEVEVKLQGNTVKATTCECSRFKEIGFCEHLTAFLFLLRQKQSTPSKKVQAPTKKKSSNRKLTTNVILENIQPNELQSFVKEYAKNNRSFALALKARFAVQVLTIEGKEKYLQLLDTTISIARKTNLKISKRGGQKILGILEELEQQIEWTTQLGHFGESFAIIQAIVEKIPPILSKVDDFSAPLLKVVDQTFEFWQQLLGCPLPPSLKESMWGYAMEEHIKLNYRNNQVDLGFFKILLELAETFDQKRELLEAVQRQFQKYKTEKRQLAPILFIELSTLELIGSFRKAEELIQENLNDPEILLHAIRQAMAKDEFDRAKQLITIGSEFPNMTAVKKDLNAIMLQIAEIQEDQKAISETSKRCFLDTLEFQFFLQCQKATPEKEWPKMLASILESLDQLPYSISKRDTIAKILNATAQLDELLNYIKTNRSIDLLLLCDKELFEHLPQEVYQVYKELLTSYLKDHIGPIPSKKAKRSILHLKAIGGGEIAEQLIEEFRLHFPERHTLMEELAYL